MGDMVGEKDWGPMGKKGLEPGIKNWEPSGQYDCRRGNKFGDHATNKARAWERKLGTKQPLRLETGNKFGDQAENKAGAGGIKLGTKWSIRLEPVE